MPTDPKPSYPPYMIIVHMKDGEEEVAEATSEHEFDTLLAEVMADKDVATWVAYKQFKSAYPAQS